VAEERTQNKAHKTKPDPSSTKHVENAQVIFGKKIRALDMEMTGTKPAKKTAENTPGKKMGKSSTARQEGRQESLGEKKAMVRDAVLACRAKFPYSLKMTH
jgi:hypothetical protein